MCHPRVQLTERASLGRSHAAGKTSALLCSVVAISACGRVAEHHQLAQMRCHCCLYPAMCMLYTACVLYTQQPELRPSVLLLLLVCLLTLQYVPLLRRSFELYTELERETKQVARICWTSHRRKSITSEWFCMHKWCFGPVVRRNSTVGGSHPLCDRTAQCRQYQYSTVQVLVDKVKQRAKSS